MTDEDRTREQLIGELTELRRRVSDLEAERQRMEEALRESEQRHQVVVESAINPVFATDAEGALTFVSSRMAEMFGYTPEEMLGMPLWSLAAPGVGERVRALFIENMPRGGELEAEASRKDGSRFSSMISFVPVIRGKTPQGVAGRVQDITERKLMEEELVHVANHDALTGLPNRRLFNDRLTVALAHARRERQKVAVMLLDLDHFKNVNDTLGHHAGDQLLQAVALRLSGLLREGDTVARMGGDEFLLILPQMGRAEYAATVAQRITEAIREPFQVDGHELHVTTSIGIAIYPDDVDSEDNNVLLGNADIAMYCAKNEGRDTYRRHTPDMSAAFLRITGEPGETRRPL